MPFRLQPSRSLLALAAALLLTASPAQAKDKTYVLCLHAHVTEKAPGEENIFSKRIVLPDERLQRIFDEHGIVIGAERFSTKMTWEYLKQFNVVVMEDFPIVEKHPTVKDEIRRVEQLLARFVAEGGGLVLTGMAEYGQWSMERDMEELNRFLKPYGGQVLYEQIAEKDLGKTYPSLGAGAMAWTGNVAKHALTEGVRGLIYPTYVAWSYTTHPVRVDENWQVLLKGSPTAYSYSIALGRGRKKKMESKRPGVHKTAPPMLAVRQAGKGRIVLWPTAPTTFFIDAYHRFWGNGMVMEGTDKQMPSDGRKLLMNLLAWLAEPSKGKGVLGGYTPPPKAGIGNEVGFQRIKWDRVTFEKPAFPNVWRGLVGMRSSLSTGRSSPAEMIAAARKAGYHFAAFAEDLEKLDAKKFDSLIKLCASSSDDTFQVYAGFTYHDESGNAWVTFARHIHWPLKHWWSSKRKGAIAINNMIFRGYQSVPVIMTRPNKNPEKPWFQGNFKGMAVYTFEGSKLVDDARDTYVRMQGDNFKCWPTVVREVRSADEVAAAAKGGPQAYVLWHELSDVASAVSGNYAMYKGGHVFQRTSFVSSGPILRDLRVRNFGSSELTIPANDRMRIHLKLTSDKGLAEVKILDQGRLFRRFLPTGKKKWTVDVDAYHGHNHDFVVIARDTAGGVLVSPDRWTCVQALNVPRCTDNLNTYVGGKFKGVNKFAIRGYENYIDRQAGGMNYFPLISGVAEMKRPAVDQRLVRVGRFGYVRRDVLHYAYPLSASANWNKTDACELAVPVKAIKGHTTLTLFTPRANSTVAYLVEGDFTAQQDVTVPGGRVYVYQGRWVADASTFYASRPDGSAFCSVLGPRRSSYVGSFKDTEYVANLAPPGGSRALFPLSPNLAYRTMTNRKSGRTHLGAMVDLGRKKLAKGERVQYRYLAVWSTVGARPDNTFMEDVCNKMGLRGKTAYTVKPRHGKVADTKFALTLEAAGGGFAGTISQAKLPMALPCWIDGLNDRWPAGIWYKGRNLLVTPTWKMNRVAQRFTAYPKRAGKDQLLRFGVLDGRGMLQVDTEVGAKDVYIGNLLVCDQPDVFLSLDDARPGKASATANNPTDKALTCTIKPGPGFDLLGKFAKTVELPAGGYVTIALR
jgi:hypothetical protein